MPCIFVHADYSNSVDRTLTMVMSKDLQGRDVELIIESAAGIQLAAWQLIEHSGTLCFV